MINFLEDVFEIISKNMIREFVLYHLFGSSNSPNPEIPPTEEEDGYD